MEVFLVSGHTVAPEVVLYAETSNPRPLKNALHQIYFGTDKSVSEATSWKPQKAKKEGDNVGRHILLSLWENGIERSSRLLLQLIRM